MPPVPSGTNRLGPGDREFSVNRCQTSGVLNGVGVWARATLETRAAAAKRSKNARLLTALENTGHQREQTRDLRAHRRELSVRDDCRRPRWGNSQDSGFAWFRLEDCGRFADNQRGHRA
jgi:hypothetical protein